MGTAGDFTFQRNSLAQFNAEDADADAEDAAEATSHR
jgi:hypothetical protein